MNNFMGYKREAMSTIYPVSLGLGVWGFFNDAPQENIMAFLNNDSIVYGFLGFGLVGMIVDFFLLYKKLIRNKKKAAEKSRYKIEVDQHINSEDLFGPSGRFIKKVIYKKNRPHWEETFNDDGSLDRKKRLR